MGTRTRTPNKTGEACSLCGEPEVFEPGYLVRQPEGGRWFTAVRVVEHTAQCPALNLLD